MTTDEKTKHWEKLSNRERDAFGSEHIFARPVKWFPCWRDPECGTIQVQANGPDDPDMSVFSGTTEPCYCPEDMMHGYDDPTYWEVIPNYSTDASADYLILEKVQNEWYRQKFQMFSYHLTQLAIDRSSSVSRGDDEVAALYSKGDYIHAAWLALASIGEGV